MVPIHFSERPNFADGSGSSLTFLHLNRTITTFIARPPASSTLELSVGP